MEESELKNLATRRWLEWMTFYFNYNAEQMNEVIIAHGRVETVNGNMMMAAKNMIPKLNKVEREHVEGLGTFVEMDLQTFLDMLDSPHTTEYGADKYQYGVYLKETGKLLDDTLYLKVGTWHVAYCLVS